MHMCWNRTFIVVISLIVILINSNIAQNQWNNVNAIPDANGNWQFVGTPPPNSNPNGPLRVNGEPGELPMRVNSPGGNGQQWNPDESNRPEKWNGQDGAGGRRPWNQDGGRGQNPGRNINNRYENSTSPMKNMMRGMLEKARNATGKIMNLLRQSNTTFVIGRRQTRQFIPSACAQEMLQIQSDCFTKNGYTMDSFIQTIQNGSFSPENSQNAMNGIKDQLCKKRQDILNCVIPAIFDKRDKPPCLDAHDYNYAQEMTLKAVKIIQDICEAGLLPPPPICVPLVNREMQRCYTKVGFSSDMFISDDRDVEGAVIGKDLEASKKFCSARRELYDCMRLVMRNCPDAERHLLVTGHDQTAIEKSIDVLCDNKQVYVDGLECFQEPSLTVHNCIDVMTSQMLDLDANQMLKNMQKDEYFTEFCRIRVQHMECDTTAWKESCHKVTVGLKNEFQCAMLPEICHNITEIDDVLHNKVCRKEAYLQALRAPYNGGSFRSVSLFSILTIGITVLFMVL